MREIKFRAWDERKNTWQKEFWLDMNGSIYYVGDLPSNTFDKDYTAKQKHIKILQYTGIKDKNGVEIYEGDIVKWYIGDMIMTADIYYDDRQASFWMGKHNGTFLTLNDWMIGEYEVIGNIYENTELLHNNLKDKE